MWFIKASLILFMCIALLACDGDVLPPVEGCDDKNITYSSETKEIIDLTCAYSGCHDGQGGAPGDFTSYAAMERYLKDGSFTKRVIDLKDNPVLGMPPNKSVYPESLQDDLTAEQLEMITCWIENDFTE